MPCMCSAIWGPMASENVSHAGGQKGRLAFLSRDMTRKTHSWSGLVSGTHIALACLHVSASGERGAVRELVPQAGQCRPFRSFILSYSDPWPCALVLPGSFTDPAQWAGSADRPLDLSNFARKKETGGLCLLKGQWSGEKEARPGCGSGL